MKKTLSPRPLQAIVGLPLELKILVTNPLVQDPYFLQYAPTSSVQFLLDREMQRRHQTNQAGKESCEN